MIQRKQSIFLLLAAISYLGLYLLPLAKSEVLTSGFFVDNDYDVFDQLVLTIVTAVGAIIALVAIFLFKNRKLQLKLGYVNIVIALIFIGIAILFYTQEFSFASENKLEAGLGIGLPIFAILFTLFGNRFIKKDENLVKSMDRLR